MVGQGTDVEHLQKIIQVSQVKLFLPNLHNRKSHLTASVLCDVGIVAALHAVLTLVAGELQVVWHLSSIEFDWSFFSFDFSGIGSCLTASSLLKHFLECCKVDLCQYRVVLSS